MENMPRKPISEEKKKTESVAINLTKKQKLKLEKAAEEAEISLSQVCVNALKAQKII